MSLFGQRGGTTHVDVAVSAEKHLRLSRLGRELRLTDQILSNDLDTVSIVQDGPAPAWTTLDGDHVSFALSQMPFPDSKPNVAVWLGTNAHELGHVLFTPRSDTPLVRRILEGDQTFMRGVANLHNIVEDQRQERLILARFAPWRGYLTAALGHHFQGETDTSWLLMAGRTWLPGTVRANARRLFVKAQGEWMATQVSTLIGDYQRLVDPGETEADEAWAILDRLYDLLGQKVPPVQYRCSEIGGHGTPDTTGIPGGDSRAPKTADEADPGDGDGTDPDGDTDGGDDSTPDSQSRSQSSSDAGDGTGDDSSEGMRRALTDAAEKQIGQDAEANDDLESIMDALTHASSGGDAQGNDPLGSFSPATDTARHVHKDVADALLDLKDDSEPGWTRRTDSGRLNVRRLVNPYMDADELFDRYDAGQMDASELDVVLLLDVSGSMGAHVTRLAEVTWALRHAVDDLDGTMNVITWDSGPHRVLASAGDRPDDRMFVPTVLGGTNPHSALVESYRLLAGSDARNRLVVILTDGEWSNVRPSEQVIDALNEAGVITTLAHLGNLGMTVVQNADGSYQIDADGQYVRVPQVLDPHHCRYARQINELTELARLFRDVAVEQIGSWL